LPRSGTPALVHSEFVLTKCDYFVDVQLWPLKADLNPQAWLENFISAELPHATQLLNAFLYFSERMVDEMFVAAFQALSHAVTDPSAPFLAVQNAWRAFVDAALFTHVTGEVPSTTDSGFAFARRARQLLQIPEERILTPRDVLMALLAGPPRPVVFVDDFVGSGNQFIETWERITSVSHTLSLSFKTIAESRRGDRFFYCPAFCTEHGLSEIKRRCPPVVVSAAHVLPARYSVLAHDSLIWPPDLLPSATDFVRVASLRAGIPDANGGVDDWRGYHQLGLALAFGRSIPDATIPLFYWERNGWKPLMPRR